MSRDVITVGSTMRIPLLYRGKYSQWHERFMNYLEEQTDGEAMINSIQNGDQPLPVIGQVSLAGTAQNAPHTLKDLKFWIAKEKKTRKIDHLARSLLIQGLPNDIYSLIDSNETAKDLWNALERQMRGCKYGEQDRKAAILYEYDTFKATEGEQLLDTYLRYLQVINDLKKCGYKKDTRKLNYKFLNNLQQEWKEYGTLRRQTKNLMHINIDALYNILKQNQGDVNDALGYKKKSIVVTLDPLALVAEKTKVSKRKEKVVVSLDSEGSGADDFSELKKITTLLAKAFNRRKFYSKPTNSNLRTSSTSQFANKKQEFVKSNDKKEINANMVFMAQIEKILSDPDESSSSAEETIAEVAYYTSESESESEYETLEYYDKSINYGLFVIDNDDQEIFHDAIEFSSKNLIENYIDFQKDYDKSEVDHNDSEEKEHLADKLIHQFNHKIAKCQKHIKKANQQSKDLENQNKDLQEKYEVLINQVNTFEEQNNEFNDQTKVLNKKNVDLLAQTEVLQDQLEVKHVVIDTHTECFENPSYFEKEKELRPSLYDEKVIENQGENDCHVVEKECDNVENPKVIAPGMFKLSVSQSVSLISVTKTSCDSKNVENKTKRKRCKRKSLKQNDKQVNNDVSRANSDVVHFSNLDTFSSVRRPKHSSVIWKKKGSSITSNVDLSSDSLSKLNKDVKRYSRKDLLSCNKSHLRETGSAYVCNDAMNVSCNSRLCDSFDVNNLFIFDDESVRISPISKMSVRKNPRDSMNVRYKSNLNKSLPRTVHRWLPKMQPLAEPIVKGISRIVQICLWIIDSRCSKHMTGNRALLTNFVEKFFGTVRFGNNDFAVIAGYGDVVNGSMTIKKVYYVEGLGHNLFSVVHFCDKGLEVAFRKSTCFVRNEDGVDLLNGDRSSNLYTIALNEVASNSSTCLLAKASSSQSWLWNQRLSHLNFATINNLVKNNLV
nr:integrase, catalytic region, zinc finger, CCHC-type, peptidase aspartic, catalytic [Tanacetum cinerariifolium]